MLHILFLMLLSLLLDASHLHDIPISGSEFPVTADNGSPYLWRHVFHLVIGQRRVCVSNCFDKRKQLLPEMVAGFFWHLGWQMVHGMEQNGVFVGIGDFLFEFFGDRVIKQKWLFNRSELRSELDGTHVICGDITHSQELRLFSHDGFSELVDGKDSWVLGFPIDAVEQEMHVGQVLEKLGLVLTRALVVMLFAERSLFELSLPPHQVFLRKHTYHNLLIIHVSQSLPQFIWIHFNVWQLLQHF